MANNIEKKSWLRGAGVMAAVFGLGLIMGLGIGRNVESATAASTQPLPTTDSMWVVNGPLQQMRDRQMDEVASAVKEALELDPEQEAAFDEVHEQVRSEVDRILAEIAPDIAAAVQASAVELRAMLTEEQMERLMELRSSGLPVPSGSRTGG